MKAVIQRVTSASVQVGEKKVSEIKKGIMVLVGFHKEDEPKDSDWLIKKILNTKIFEDENGKFAQTIEDVKGEILIVSQITLHGSLKKGTKPDFSDGMSPKEAKFFYLDFISRIKQATSLKVKDGKFGAMMDVNLTNYGPVTLLLDSRAA